MLERNVFEGYETNSNKYVPGKNALEISEIVGLKQFRPTKQRKKFFMHTLLTEGLVQRIWETF